MRDFRLDQLDSFAKVIEHGTFSAAAEKLNLTQPAISFQIRELERRLGVRLIERVGKKATPTAAGLTLLDHVKRIDGVVSATLADLLPYARGAAGRVRIGTGSTACIHLLPQVLKSVRQRFQGLEIVVKTAHTKDILKALEDNALDVGFVTPPVHGRMFEAIPVLDDPFVAIAAAGDDRLPRSVTPQAMAGLPVILYDAEGNTRQIVDRWFARAGITLTPAMEMGNTEAIRKLVAAGVGYAILPTSALEDRSSIETRPLSPAFHRNLAIVLRRDKILGKGLRMVVEALKEVKL